MARLISERFELQESGGLLPDPHKRLEIALAVESDAGVLQRSGSVVAIGKFDGIHRGHLSLLSLVRSEARNSNLQAGVVTFDRHPAAVLHGTDLACLTTLRDRQALFGNAGMDFMLLLRATPELFAIEPEDFVSALIEVVDCRVIIVGADFRFGRGAKGNTATLERLAHLHGVQVAAVELQMSVKSKISSTQIREELSAGQVEQVRRSSWSSFLGGWCDHDWPRTRMVNRPHARYCSANPWHLRGGAGNSMR